MQAFTTQFTLSRAYLAECFDQTLPYGKNAKPNYTLPVVFFVLGMGLLAFIEDSGTVGFMLIVLAVMEVLHIRFRRAWWLTRQMWGRSADSEVKLSLDENGINTQNPYTKTSVLWSDIQRVIETELGLILVAKSGGQQYLSKSLFSDAVISEILAISNE
ncbi:YcxB family protein [Agarivorans sp. DSG3-1]|uniref:YcxB family protein n=1 Tax=Agarivorans sp. DSG3-1 TaxID=3342249 RepID=UPI00398E9AFF